MSKVCRGPTNNQEGQRSRTCRSCGGLDKARHVVPTGLIVRVQCYRKSMHMAVGGPSIIPIVFSMIPLSHTADVECVWLFLFRGNEIIWALDRSTFVNKITVNELVGDFFFPAYSWNGITPYFDISQLFYEACDICNPVITIWMWFVWFLMQRSTLQHESEYTSKDLHVTRCILFLNENEKKISNPWGITGRDEIRYVYKAESNLNYSFHCPCTEKRSTQSNLGSSASEIPRKLSF